MRGGCVVDGCEGVGVQRPLRGGVRVSSGDDSGSSTEAAAAAAQLSGLGRRTGGFRADDLPAVEEAEAQWQRLDRRLGQDDGWARLVTRPQWQRAAWSQPVGGAPVIGWAGRGREKKAWGSQMGRGRRTSVG